MNRMPGRFPRIEIRRTYSSGRRESGEADVESRAIRCRPSPAGERCVGAHWMPSGAWERVRWCNSFRTQNKSEALNLPRCKSGISATQDVWPVPSHRCRSRKVKILKPALCLPNPSERTPLQRLSIWVHLSGEFLIEDLCMSILDTTYRIHRNSSSIYFKEICQFLSLRRTAWHFLSTPGVRTFSFYSSFENQILSGIKVLEYMHECHRE